MNVRDLKKILEPLDGGMVIHIPNYDDSGDTKEATTVGISGVDCKVNTKPIVIIDFE